MQHNNTIAFIGTGRIARALIAGLSKDASNTITGFDINSTALEEVCAEFGVTAAPTARDAAKDADIVILAVKPYQVGELLEDLRPALNSEQILISVAAGISTAFMEKAASCPIKVIRVMPNTPAFVGKGMTAICRGSLAGNEELALAEKIFSAVGTTVVLDEPLMDAATAVSGSGPAYMFHIIASLAEGGIAEGLSKKDATLLATQTMLGAATMVLEGDMTPEELKGQVTTPGGTTEAGLKEMERHDVRQAMIDTVSAAANRSRELKQ